ncbi:succinyl-diaminopimelate desuccinylase [Oricola thermophila]|uniref:Succinyl-diaminopimelate desuccinylase n=1 Tax=Oricola thermophila TaxID=2742145 RepID=A0A6N1VMK7_9HYPH|nr:succinyl-diaminopimelate desuccinylase [Oricola thermophila]QKV20662.1 succinyl-diaminopimelate desuccinylase [Oricola thermophila]
MSSASDPVENLRTLIRCPSVTPAEGGALGALEAMLKPLGFETERPVFREDGTPDIENLHARLGSKGPHLAFAGHTDVVPTGDESAWSHPPFAAEISDGMMYGRGAVDMKGGIACFVAAVARHVQKYGPPKGSISFLITGDEEGPAINGTKKLLKWAADRGETWDGCVLGEPTNPETIGDMIKIGRRGSISGRVTVSGVQGHVAYPHLADNPLRGIVQVAEALLDPPLDDGTDQFQPTNLEITTIDTGNPATNVIPASATLAFNIRFNDRWTADSLKAEIEARVARGAAATRLRPGKSAALKAEVEWPTPVSPVFLTRDETLISTVAGAVEAVTGRMPALSTSGGTSDARFIKDYCPVVEFGLVGRTMHMIDECVAVEDLETLTAIYERVIADWFAGRP